MKLTSLPAPVKTVNDPFPKNVIWDQILKDRTVFQMPSDGRYYFKASFDVSQVTRKTYLIPDLVLLFTNLDFQESRLRRAECIHIASASWGSSDGASLSSAGKAPGPRPFWSGRRRARFIEINLQLAGKEWVPMWSTSLLPCYLTNTGRRRKSSSQSSAGKKSWWLKTLAGQGSMAPSFPRTSWSCNTPWHVWKGKCLMFAMITKATLPPSWTNSTVLSCGINNDYGWDQTGFHGAFVRFPKPGSCG